MASTEDQPPLPYGWIQEYDSRTDHPFYVDTKADPPRAIWVHPYEDEQYLNEHPEVKEKVGAALERPRPSKLAKSTRRHSFNGNDSPDMVTGADVNAAATASKGKGKRGFFGKIKDKAIGTKEEREAHKREQMRIEEERRKQRQELLRAREERYRQQQERFAQQQAVYGQSRFGGYPGAGFAGPSQVRYGPPAGDPYGYGMGGYDDGYGYGYGRRGRRGGGFGGGALPLVGALAGGLLLGELIG